MEKSLYALLGGEMRVLYVGEDYGEFCKALNSSLNDGEFFESYTIRRKEGCVSLLKLTGKVEGKKLEFDQRSAIPITINEERVLQALKGFI